MNLTYTKNQINYNIPYVPPVKKIKSIIPLNLFQTWHTLQLPFYMQQNVEILKNQNPEFKHHLYDDSMCRSFIEKHFDKDVLHAFDKLKPGAYKADLWRYCILFKKGGIYLDIKYRCCHNFKLIYVTDAEHFVQDRPSNNLPGIYQAFLVCLPNNKVLYDCIYKIVDNVKLNSYECGVLDVTGPSLLGKYISFDKCSFILNNSYIKKKMGGPILESYPQYKIEQNKYQKTNHYGVLWNNLNIYNYVILKYESKNIIQETNSYYYKNKTYENKSNIKCLENSYTTLQTCKIKNDTWLLCYKKQSIPPSIFGKNKSLFSKWQHYFIVHDSNENIIKYSELFHFEPTGSEICLDFCYKDELIVFKYNTPYKKSYVTKCDTNWLDTHLKWYTN